ncbi:MAG: hypothetical protein AABX66_01320 [Nanoarchaeota archaeon]
MGKPRYEIMVGNSPGGLDGMIAVGAPTSLLTVECDSGRVVVKVELEVKVSNKSKDKERYHIYTRSIPSGKSKLGRPEREVTFYANYSSLITTTMHELIVDRTQAMIGAGDTRSYRDNSCL